MMEVAWLQVVHSLWDITTLFYAENRSGWKSCPAVLAHPVLNSGETSYHPDHLAPHFSSPSQHYGYCGWRGSQIATSPFIMILSTLSKSDGRTSLELGRNWTYTITW